MGIEVEMILRLLLASALGAVIGYQRERAGIGFLGAGAILHREGGIVEGLTTAATVWAVAAVGMGVGAGLYLVSVVATAITMIVLFLPRPIR